MDNFPRVIEFQLHNCCNANCIICPYKELDSEKRFMDLNLFRKLISEIGDREILLIPYLNNEPFLDTEFCEKIEEINRVCPNCKVEISTNISKLTKKNIEKMKKMKISDFRISFFGYKRETYQKIMPGLDYDMSWHNLKMFLESGLKNKIDSISVTMIEHEAVQKEEFDLMSEFCKENGIRFNRWGYLDRAGNNSYYKNESEQGDIIGCEQNRPYERMHIMSDGSVILCCQDWREEVVLGNIRDNTILEIWNSEKYKEVRDAIYHCNSEGIELCKKCKLAIRRKLSETSNKLERCEYKGF